LNKYQVIYNNIINNEIEMEINDINKINDDKVKLLKQITDKIIDIQSKNNFNNEYSKKIDVNINQIIEIKNSIILFDEKKENKPISEYLDECKISYYNILNEIKEHYEGLKILEIIEKEKFEFYSNLKDNILDIEIRKEINKEKEEITEKLNEYLLQIIQIKDTLYLEENNNEKYFQEMKIKFLEIEKETNHILRQIKIFEKTKFVKNELENSLLKKIENYNQTQKFKIHENYIILVNKMLIELSDFINNFEGNIIKISNEAYFSLMDRYNDLIKELDKNYFNLKVTKKTNSLRKSIDLKSFRKSLDTLLHLNSTNNTKQKSSESFNLVMAEEKKNITIDDMLKESYEFKSLRDLRIFNTKNLYINERKLPKIIEYELYKNLLEKFEYIELEKIYYHFESNKINEETFIEKKNKIISKFNLLPKPIEDMIEFIETECNQTIGLFSTSGHSKSITTMTKLLNEGNLSFIL
jgi:hypothetical protein